MAYLVEHFFAGSWAFVWHWGVGIGIILLCLAGAFFSTSIPLIGPWLGGVRKDLEWAAALTALFLAGEVVGAHDAANRCKAQTVVVERQVDKAVEKSKTPGAQSKSDKWDRPEY